MDRTPAPAGTSAKRRADPGPADRRRAGRAPADAPARGQLRRVACGPDGVRTDRGGRFSVRVARPAAGTTVVYRLRGARRMSLPVVLVR
jgi:hypothetical protein